MSYQPKIGTIGWTDLTVPDADSVRDFYAAVTGWKPEPVAMGGYNDYNMTSEGTAIAGVCHKRGSNSGLPPAWMIYIVVADLDASMRECRERGGKIMVGPSDFGGQGRYCVIEDPAGAVCAIFQPPCETRSDTGPSR